MVWGTSRSLIMIIINVSLFNIIRITLYVWVRIGKYAFTISAGFSGDFYLKYVKVLHFEIMTERGVSQQQQVQLLFSFFLFFFSKLQLFLCKKLRNIRGLSREISQTINTCFKWPLCSLIIIPQCVCSHFRPFIWTLHCSSKPGPAHPSANDHSPHQKPHHWPEC